MHAIGRNVNLYFNGSALYLDSVHILIIALYLLYMYGCEESDFSL